ncbi:DUF58 domain-containing protein [Cellulomonas soli]|uniref:DUF58 domain-containing protein n=1 Tax=Cellulomonas soli TaxID=931535 RepID=UPI0011BD5B2E|nr:DUF58 domain-containing protein [Cellulomonas soli]NYI58780.1 uncharacterized protein (DUF58 family) [Cellulomonas soli]
MVEGWARTRASDAAVLVGAVLLVVGALTGRPDVAVLGAAPVVAGFWERARRPRGVVRLELTDAEQQDPDVQEAGSAGTVHATVRLRVPEGAAAAVLRVRRGARQVDEVLVLAEGGRDLPLVVRTVRTGPQEIATVDAQGVGVGAATVSEPTGPVSRATLVLPVPGPLRDLPLPQRLRGLTGAHESRRPGEGGGLRDVHPYVTGDRLRRIDWRVTARRAPDLHELYVRREHALAEAVVLLVVDSRDDVGPDPRTWRGEERPLPQDPTSLDLARTAAASLAQGYLGLGDRVGLDDLGVRRRPLPPGGGRRQLERIRHALAVTHPAGEPTVRVRAPQVPSGALVVVFSTFLDDEAAAAAGHWRRSGHRVLAVDVLPTVRRRGLDDRELLATRLVLLAREDRLAGLADLDVEVVTWRDAPAVALAGLARRGRRRPGAGVPA